MSLPPSPHPGAAVGLPLQPVLKALRAFFAHHGVWAPGVRLLRRLSVLTKLVLLMGLGLAAVLPLAVFTGGTLVRQAADDAQRLRDLRVGRQLSMLAVALDVQRLAVARGQATAASAQRLAERWQALKADWTDGAEPTAALRLAWESQHPVVEGAVRAAADSRSGVEAFDAGLAALRDLHLAGLASNPASPAAPWTLAATDLALGLLPAVETTMQRLAETEGQLALVPAGDANRPALLLRLARQVESLSELSSGVGARLLQLSAGGKAAAGSRQVLADYLGRLEQQLGAAMAGPVPALDAARHAAALAEVQTLSAAVMSMTEQALEQASQRARELRNRVAVLLALALALEVYLLVCFYSVMRGGLRQLRLQMTRMADGDLTLRPEAVGHDEVAQTMIAMNLSLRRLGELMSAVTTGVDGVNQAALLTARGHTELQGHHGSSAGTARAASISVAANAALMQACARQVEAVVHHVSALRLESTRNRKQMQRLRQRMTDLRGSSREIAEIVTLIDGIAARTNILALNASVEASKAGAAGRGFAVVAQEVRSLAQRGASSAKRIGAIVARSTGDIEQGHAVVEETSLALAHADRCVDQIHSAMDSLAATMAEGTAASAQTLAQLQSIRERTQQGENLVEQLTQASHQARLVSNRLSHQVKQFKLA